MRVKIWTLSSLSVTAPCTAELREFSSTHTLYLMFVLLQARTHQTQDPQVVLLTQIDCKYVGICLRRPLAFCFPCYLLILIAKDFW